MVTLIEAARNGKLSQVCQILCAGRTDINCRDSEKKGTPLFWAANGGYDDIVTLLLDSGADKEIPVKWGMTPLLAAVDRKHLSTAKILLARGADVNAQSQNGDTALHLAAYRGSTSLCKLLIDYGANKHFLNNTGKTAQQGAEAAGHKNIIKLLASETSHKAVCRSSSLPSAQCAHSPVEDAWREARVPSESDDSPFINEEEEEWNSLQRKQSKAPLQHPMAMAIRRDGDILRYYSAQQLDKVGRVSPPSTQPSTAHWRSPHLHLEDSMRPPRRGSNPETHRDNSGQGQTPGHHYAGAHFSRDMKQDSNRRWSPPLPRQHSAGSSVRQYPAVPLHRDGHFDFLESSGNGPIYKTNGQSAKQMLHSQHSVPGYFSRELSPSYKEPLPNVSNGRDIGHRLRPDSPRRTQEMGDDYYQRMDMSRNFKGEHMQHPGILANAGSAMANTGHIRTTDNHVQWSADIPHRHKDREQLTQGLVNPNGTGVPGVEHQRLSTDLSSAGVSYRQSTERSANVQNASRDAVQRIAQDLEVRQLHSVIEQLLEDKLTLTEQNQMMGERLNRLELALDAALAADSSSEGSWQTSSDSDLVQALAKKLDSNLGRSSRLEQLCLKLLDDNQRLHALSAPSARLEGSRIDSQQSRGLIDGHSTPSGNPDLRPGTGCTGGRSPSERSTSSSSLSPTSTSSYDYGSGSDHLASLQKSSGDEECLPQERTSVKQQNSRMTFARECWRSLNSTCPRVAFQSGSIASTAMKVGGITLASQNRTENIKKVLQALNENDKQCNTRGQYSTDHGDIGQLDFSHTVDILEKLSYTAGPDGSISAEFLCEINKKQFRLKVNNSKRFEQEYDAVENVEEFLSPSPYLHLPIHRFEACPGGDGRLSRQILKQLQANLPQTQENIPGSQENIPGSQETGHHPSGRQDGDRGLHRNAGYHLEKDSFFCRVYPPAILNLVELFEWGMMNIEEDAAPGTDTGIIRILLQLLLAVDHLHQKGVTHGNIHPGCVYVMEDLRVVLGGLEKARHLDRRCGIAEVTTGQISQETEDTFAIAETLCKLLGSQRGSPNSPAEATNKLVNTPPDWLPVNLQNLLREMLSNDPENRPPVKSALLRAAAMLYGPGSEEVSSEADCEEWLISQALRLIITAPHDRSLSQKEEQDYSDCIYRLDWGLSRDFILRVTPQQLWKFCQQHVKT